MYFVSIAILALASLISSMVSKSVVAFLIVISFLIAGIYIGHGLQVIFLPFHNIIKVLSLGKELIFICQLYPVYLYAAFRYIYFTRKISNVKNKT